MIETLLNIRSSRVEQLERDSIIDNRLKKECKKCPNILVNYLLNGKHINYKFAKAFEETSYYNYPSLMKINMSYLDKRMDSIEHILENENSTCLQLDQFIKNEKSKIHNDKSDLTNID